ISKLSHASTIKHTNLISKVLNDLEDSVTPEEYKHLVVNEDWAPAFNAALGSGKRRVLAKGNSYILKSKIYNFKNNVILDANGSSFVWKGDGSGGLSSAV